jgi:hypothetical protein
MRVHSELRSRAQIRWVIRLELEEPFELLFGRPISTPRDEHPSQGVVRVRRLWRKLERRDRLARGGCLVVVPQQTQGQKRVRAGVIGIIAQSGFQLTPSPGDVPGIE